MLPAEERGCSYRLWTHEDGRAIKPPCGLAYNYPGVLLVDEPGADTTKMATVMLSIRGAATPAAKKLNTIVMNQGSGTWTNVIIELTVGKRNGPAGEYFVPEVEFFDLTDAEDYARIRRYARGYGPKLESACGRGYPGVGRPGRLAHISGRSGASNRPASVSRGACM
jgi:hypothetical protein